MTTFYIIRHGSKKQHSENQGLSELGKTQAKLTAVFLKKLSIEAIYSSPSVRTKETAQIISQELKLPVIEENSLRERMNWESKNQSFDEFLEEWQHATRHPEFKPRKGDSVLETAKRMEDMIKKLSRENSNKTLALVCHGGAIRDFLVILSKRLKMPFPDVGIEIVRECSITKIVYRSEKIVVKYFDNVDHLTTF